MKMRYSTLLGHIVTPFLRSSSLSPLSSLSLSSSSSFYSSSHTLPMYSSMRGFSSSTLSSSSSQSIQAMHELLTQPSPHNNIPLSIVEKVGRNLHLQESHPLGIIKKRIEDYCNAYASVHNQTPFKAFDSLSPIVDTKSCFDDLLVQPDHVSRKPTDTYYLNEQLLLRTHTSAHQCQFIGSGERAFLCTGDVYRRDEIDASHYPVFHQMEGVRIFEPGVDYDAGLEKAEIKQVIKADLKRILTGLAMHLFGDVEMRWRDDYFPFTIPSFELEVYFNGDWMEVLGCGVIHDQVMTNANKSDHYGWAFGLGLERLAMILFSIPDIRLFWSKDPRFISQFKAGKITKFQPYSRFPFCYKDVAFWLPRDGLHHNDVFEVIRDVAGDLVERVYCFDEFTHPSTGRTSNAYRITYRHMDRNLLNDEVDEIQDRVRDELAKRLRVTLR